MAEQPQNLGQPQQDTSQQKSQQNASQLNVSKLQKLNSHYFKSMKSMKTMELGHGNDNEESIIDLDYEKNLTKIDYVKMERVFRERHATKTNGEFYNCTDVCCGAGTGNHYVCSSSKKTELSKFGIGITLYFKFVKHLILFFLLFIVLSIPAYVFYIGSYATYKKSNGSSLSYVDVLTATTVGSIGLGANSCGLCKHPTFANTTDQTKIYFECPGGTIADVSNIVYGFVASGSTCSFIDETDLYTSCNTYTTSSLDFSSCVGNSSCTITMPSGLFTTYGTSTACDNMYQYRNIYMKVACLTTTLTIFNNQISKTTIAFVVATLDAVIIMIFLIMIHSLKYAQKSAINNIQKNAYSASSYTVEIKNLPQDMPAEQLTAKLWSFFDEKLGEKSIKAGHRVVDVQIVLPNKLIEDSKEYGDLIHKKNTLIRQFMQLYVPDYTKNEIDFTGLQKVMASLKLQREDPKLKEAEKLFKKIKHIVQKKEKLFKEIQKTKTTKHIRLVSAFVTLSSIPAREKILETFKSSPLDRLSRAICCCCSEKNIIAFHGKVLEARTAADPGAILWENLGEPSISIYARRGFSFALTIVLWIITAAILIVSTYYKNYFKNNFASIDCTNLNPTSTAAAADYLLGNYQTGLLGCYCSADFLDRIDEVFPTADNQTLCLIWFRNKVIETSVTFAIVFIVLIINYFIQFVFQTLSQFEKHSTLNQQVATRVLKTFVAQFLNTGLLLLIVNAKIDISFWNGKFNDLPPLWYENVGSTLLSTMFINIVTVPLVKAMAVVFQKLLQCCDRGCKTDKRVTKKKTQTEYENLYTGPEFIIDFRYSQILTLIFVCFLYSGGMPLLYFSTFLQLVFTYFFDKFLLLRVSKLPINYDGKLEAMVRPTLYIVMFGHLIFTIFMFGNSQIFNQSLSTTATVSATNILSQISSSSENVVRKFFTRAVLDYNLILFLVLLLLAAIFLIKGILYGVLKRTVLALFSKGEEEDETEKDEKVVKKGNFRKVASEVLPNYSFFHVIKAEDIASLIRLTKVTLKTTQDEELVSHLKMKLDLLKQEYNIKKKEAENKKEDANLIFIGFYTYDVRLHPSYKSQFAIEEMLDDETLD